MVKERDPAKMFSSRPEKWSLIERYDPYLVQQGEMITLLVLETVQGVGVVDDEGNTASHPLGISKIDTTERYISLFWEVTES